MPSFMAKEGNYSIESAATTNEAAQQGAIGSASQNPALKARSSKAQGASPGIRHSPEISPERAAQLRSFAASPFQGFYHGCSNPGFRLLRSLHPGLCCSALSALDLRTCPPGQEF